MLFVEHNQSQEHIEKDNHIRHYEWIVFHDLFAVCSLFIVFRTHVPRIPLGVIGDCSLDPREPRETNACTEKADQMSRSPHRGVI